MAARRLYRTIVVTGEPRGRFFQGPIDGALRPGIVVQIKAATEKVSGNFTFTPYNVASDGSRPHGPIMVLCEAQMRGGTIDTAYVDGELGLVYCPIPGDELLCMLADVAGTDTDTHAIGDPYMIDDGTGELLAPSSEECQPFVGLETLSTGLAADTLTHVMFSGY